MLFNRNTIDTWSIKTRSLWTLVHLNMFLYLQEDNLTNSSMPKSWMSLLWTTNHNTHRNHNISFDFARTLWWCFLHSISYMWRFMYLQLPPLSACKANLPHTLVNVVIISRKLYKLSASKQIDYEQWRIHRTYVYLSPCYWISESGTDNWCQNKGGPKISTMFSR